MYDIAAPLVMVVVIAGIVLTMLVVTATLENE